jgi:hypothetical protein
MAGAGEIEREERLLRRVLGIRLVPEVAQAGRVDPTGMAVDELVERCLLASDESREKGLVTGVGEQAHRAGVPSTAISEKPAKKRLSCRRWRSPRTHTSRYRACAG